MKVVCIDKRKGEKPVIPLTVRRVESSVFASLGFAKEHYLTAEINPGYKSFLFEWDGVPVAFCAIGNSPGKGRAYSMMVSRLVVLPAYQGLGLSKRILNFIGGLVLAQGDEYRLYIKTAHELMGVGLAKNSEWVSSSCDGKETKFDKEGFDEWRHLVGKTTWKYLTRKSYCKIYKGKPIYGYEDIMRPIKDMRDEKVCKEDRYFIDLFR